MSKKLTGALGLAAFVLWLAFWQEMPQLTQVMAQGTELHPVPPRLDHIDSETPVHLGTALTILGVAFGAWAVVLGYVLFVLRHEFAELRDTVRVESDRRRVADERAHQDRLHIERRIVELEAVWKLSDRNKGWEE